MTAEHLIEAKLSEKYYKGQVLTGKQVAALSPKQHIFVDGKHAIVVSADLNTRTRTAELIYVLGRKAFGRELYLDVPFNDMKTNVQFGVAADYSEDD